MMIVASSLRLTAAARPSAAPFPLTPRVALRCAASIRTDGPTSSGLNESARTFDSLLSTSQDASTSAETTR